MGREAIQPRDVAVPAAPYSPVVVAGDLVFTAGQVGFDAAGHLVSDRIEEQTRQVFENLRHCLQAAGCGFEDVVRVGVFLSDLTDFETFNGIYREHFSEPFPVRTTVQAGLAPGLLVEVEVVARRSGPADRAVARRSGPA